MIIWRQYVTELVKMESWMNKKFLLPLLLTLAFSANAKKSDFTPYVIKKGDNVSQVIADNALTPLYGKEQWVEKVLKLNRLTRQTAKKLEPGDVIVIPVSATYFTEKEYKDEVSVLESSWEKKVEMEFLAPKEKNLSVYGSYFNRSYGFKNSDLKIRQAFMGVLEYKKRKIDIDNRFSFNPIFSAAVYTQSNADFESNDDLVAEFTPSFLGSAALEIEDRETGYAFTVLSEYENMAVLDYDGTNYNVRSENVVWIGSGVHKYYHIGQNTYRLSLSMARGNNLDAFKYAAKLTSFIKQHYRVDITTQRTLFDLSQQTDVMDTGFSVGYRF